MTLPRFGVTLGHSKELPVKHAVWGRATVAWGRRDAAVVLGEGVVPHAQFGIPRSVLCFISSHKAGRADPEQNCELKTRQNHAVLSCPGPSSQVGPTGPERAALPPAWVLPAWGRGVVGSRGC